MEKTSKILLAKGLSGDQLQEIKNLEEACCRHEKLTMKLNLDMLEVRPVNETNDFLYYDDNKLIGFIGLYGFGSHPKEIEATGMVHPSYRHAGIFKELFNTAKQECIARRVGKILLVTEKSSDAGTSFANLTGAQYSCSEYRMKFDKSAIPSFPDLDIILRKAEHKDYTELQQLDELCFGLSMAQTEIDNRYNMTYVAEQEGKFVGKIGVLMEGNDGYIFGFGIKPDYRSHGFGRKVLSLILSKLLSEQIQTVILEVAVKNEQALLVYKSCGFEESTVYDYYEIML